MESASRYGHILIFGHRIARMDTRKDLARRRAVRALELVRENVYTEFKGDLPRAADAVGIPQSTFYRVMKQTPDKIDVIFLSAVADWLHDNAGYEDFATLWRRATREVE